MDTQGIPPMPPANWYVAERTNRELNDAELKQGLRLSSTVLADIQAQINEKVITATGRFYKGAVKDNLHRASLIQEIKDKYGDVREWGNIKPANWPEKAISSLVSRCIH